MITNYFTPVPKTKQSNRAKRAATKCRSSKQPNVRKFGEEIFVPSDVVLPVKFEEFIAFSNILELTDEVLRIRDLSADESRLTIAKNIYHAFYTKPSVRMEWPFSTGDFKLRTGCPQHFYEKCYDVPAQFAADLENDADAVSYQWQARAEPQHDFFDDINDPRPSTSLRLLLQDPSAVDTFKYPISFENFNKLVNVEDIVKQILKDFAKGDSDVLEALMKLPDLQQNVAKNYYSKFYQTVSIRKKYPFEIKACPRNIKEKILTTITAKDDEENHNLEDEISELSKKDRHEFPVNFMDFFKHTNVNEITRRLRKHQKKHDPQSFKETEHYSQAKYCYEWYKAFYVYNQIEVLNIKNFKVNDNAPPDFRANVFKHYTKPSKLRGKTSNRESDCSRNENLATNDINLNKEISEDMSSDHEKRQTSITQLEDNEVHDLVGRNESISNLHPVDLPVHMEKRSLIGKRFNINSPNNRKRHLSPNVEPEHKRRQKLVMPVKPTEPSLEDEISELSKKDRYEFPVNFMDFFKHTNVNEITRRLRKHQKKYDPQSFKETEHYSQAKYCYEWYKAFYIYNQIEVSNIKNFKVNDNAPPDFRANVYKHYTKPSKARGKTSNRESDCNRNENFATNDISYESDISKDMSSDDQRRETSNTQHEDSEVHDLVANNESSISGETIFNIVNNPSFELFTQNSNLLQILKEKYNIETHQNFDEALKKMYIKFLKGEADPNLADLKVNANYCSTLAAAMFEGFDPLLSTASESSYNNLQLYLKFNAIFPYISPRENIKTVELLSADLKAVMPLNTECSIDSTQKKPIQCYEELEIESHSQVVEASANNLCVTLSQSPMKLDQANLQATSPIVTESSVVPTERDKTQYNKEDSEIHFQSQVFEPSTNSSFVTEDQNSEKDWLRQLLMEIDNETFRLEENNIPISLNAFKEKYNFEETIGLVLKLLENANERTSIVNKSEQLTETLLRNYYLLYFKQAKIRQHIPLKTRFESSNEASTLKAATNDELRFSISNENIGLDNNDVLIRENEESCNAPIHSSDNDYLQHTTNQSVPFLIKTIENEVELPKDLSSSINDIDGATDFCLPVENPITVSEASNDDRMLILSTTLSSGNFTTCATDFPEQVTDGIVADEHIQVGYVKEKEEETTSLQSNIQIKNIGKQTQAVVSEKTVVDPVSVPVIKKELITNLKFSLDDDDSDKYVCEPIENQPILLNDSMDDVRMSLMLSPTSSISSFRSVANYSCKHLNDGIVAEAQEMGQILITNDIQVDQVKKVGSSNLRLNKDQTSNKQQNTRKKQQKAEKITQNAKVGEIVPQKTHDFRGLPLKIVPQKPTITTQATKANK